jgi:hypothetical protein
MAEQWEYLEVGTGDKRHDVGKSIVYSVNVESTDWENAPDWFPYFSNLGNQGWELVAVEGRRYIFKRRKP